MKEVTLHFLDTGQKWMLKGEQMVKKLLEYGTFSV